MSYEGHCQNRLTRREGRAKVRLLTFGASAFSLAWDQNVSPEPFVSGIVTALQGWVTPVGVSLSVYVIQG